MHDFVWLAGLCRHRLASGVTAKLIGPGTSVSRNIFLVFILIMSPLSNGEELDGETRSVALQQRLQSALAAKGPDYRRRTEHLARNGSPLFTKSWIFRPQGIAKRSGLDSAIIGARPRFSA